MADPWAGFKVVTDDRADPWASFKQIDMGGSADAEAAPERAPYSSFGEAAVGAAKALGTGILKGAVGVGTLPGNIEALGRAGINSAAGLVGVEPPVSQETLNPVTYNNLMSRIEGRFGELPKPQTTAEQYIQTLGEFIPSAGVAGGLAKGLRAASVVAPALASETAGQLTEGTQYEPYARAAGALAGGSVANMGARAITPAGRVDAVRAGNVAELERQGVNQLLAGQKTGNLRIQGLEDASLTLPGGGRMQALQSTPLEQFWRTALSKIGVDDQVFTQLGLPGARVTDEVLDISAQTIGKRFEQVGQVARILPDRLLQAGLTKAVRDYTNKTSQANRVPAVQSYVNEILSEAAKSGGMDGTKYLAIRSALRADQRAGDPALRKATQELTDQIDAAVIRNAPKDLRPQVAKFIQDNNRMWRDYLAIEKTYRRQGGASSSGLPSPQALNAEIKKQSRNLVSRNNRDLGRLARAGDDVLRPLKSSGTAERNQAISMLKSPAATAASVITGGLASGGDLLTMGASALVPYLTQVATARGISNPTIQRYMANQAIPGRVATEASRQAINPLIPFMMTRDDQ